MIGVQWIERVDREWLKKLIGHFAKTGSAFELHCWNEETEAIALAESIAKPKETDWQHGVFFEGVVSEENIPVLTMITDGEEATPFFDILIGGDLCCEHWGNEIYILRSTMEDKILSALFDEIDGRASVDEFSDKTF